MASSPPPPPADDDQLDSRPLVSPPEPISILKAEYAQTANTVFVRKLERLEADGWAGLWRVRGDGDCFYRALALALLLRLLALPKPDERSAAVASFRKRLDDVVVPSLKGAGFEEMVFEDFLEYLTDALALLSNPTTTTTSDDSTTLAALLQALQTPEQSTSIVVFLRLACSARVRADWEDYAPFLADGFGGGEGGEAGVRRFCEAEVEACGKEADHVQIAALSAALALPVRVVYLDRSGPSTAADTDGGEVDVHSFGEDHLEEGTSAQEGSVTLLYRPGHYEVLTRGSLPSAV